MQLRQLVGPGKRTLHYRYDFGDSWDHRLTVVGDQPAGDDVPRCVAGSGAAPAEDSGGVWGWAEKVQAARDPRHPEHDDVREWLDLADGATLDPTAFDVAKTDRRLGVLRGSARRG